MNDRIDSPKQTTTDSYASLLKIIQDGSPASLFIEQFERYKILAVNQDPETFSDEMFNLFYHAVLYSKNSILQVLMNFIDAALFEAILQKIIQNDKSGKLDFSFFHKRESHEFILGGLFLKKRFYHLEQYVLMLMHASLNQYQSNVEIFKLALENMRSNKILNGILPKIAPDVFIRIHDLAIRDNHPDWQAISEEFLLFAYSHCLPNILDSHALHEDFYNFAINKNNQTLCLKIVNYFIQFNYSKMENIIESETQSVELFFNFLKSYQDNIHYRNEICKPNQSEQERQKDQDKHDISNLFLTIVYNRRFELLSHFIKKSSSDEFNVYLIALVTDCDFLDNEINFLNDLETHEFILEILRESNRSDDVIYYCESLLFCAVETEVENKELFAFVLEKLIQLTQGNNISPIPLKKIEIILDRLSEIAYPKSKERLKAKGLRLEWCDPLIKFLNFIQVNELSKILNTYPFEERFPGYTQQGQTVTLDGAVIIHENKNSKQKSNHFGLEESLSAGNVGTSYDMLYAQIKTKKAVAPVDNTNISPSLWQKEKFSTQASPMVNALLKEEDMEKLANKGTSYALENGLIQFVDIAPIDFGINASNSFALFFIQDPIYHFTSGQVGENFRKQMERSPLYNPLKEWIKIGSHVRADNNRIAHSDKYNKELPYIIINLNFQLKNEKEINKILNFFTYFFGLLRSDKKLPNNFNLPAFLSSDTDELALINVTSTQEDFYSHIKKRNGTAPTNTHPVGFHPGNVPTAFYPEATQAFFPQYPIVNPTQNMPYPFFNHIGANNDFSFGNIPTTTMQMTSTQATAPFLATDNTNQNPPFAFEIAPEDLLHTQTTPGFNFTENLNAGLTNTPAAFDVNPAFQPAAANQFFYPRAPNINQNMNFPHTFFSPENSLRLNTPQTTTLEQPKETDEEKSKVPAHPFFYSG